MLRIATTAKNLNSMRFASLLAADPGIARPSSDQESSKGAGALSMFICFTCLPFMEETITHWEDGSMETHTATRSLIRSVRSFLVCLRCVLHFSSVCSPQALLGEGVSWSCSGVCDALVACISREFRSFRSSFYIQVLSDFIRISRLPKFPSSFGVRKPGAMERFAAQHTCFVSGSVTIVIFPSFKMKIDEWAVRELESPHANGILCRDLLFPGIHSPGGLGRRGGGGAKKKKFSGLHTRSCFFVFWPPPPPPACRPPFLEPHLKAMPFVLNPQDLL